MGKNVVGLSKTVQES